MPSTYSHWNDLDHERSRREWTVSVDIEIDEPLASDDPVFAFSDLMQRHAGAVAGGVGSTRYGATFTLEHGGDALGVLKAGVTVVRELASEAGLPGGRHVALEVAPVTDE